MRRRQRAANKFRDLVKSQPAPNAGHNHFALLHPFSGIVDPRSLDPGDAAYAVGISESGACVGGTFATYRSVPRQKTHNGLSKSCDHLSRVKS